MENNARREVFKSMNLWIVVFRVLTLHSPIFISVKMASNQITARRHNSGDVEVKKKQIWSLWSFVCYKSALGFSLTHVNSLTVLSYESKCFRIQS